MRYHFIKLTLLALWSFGIIIRHQLSMIMHWSGLGWKKFSQTRIFAGNVITGKGRDSVKSGFPIGRKRTEMIEVE